MEFSTSRLVGLFVAASLLPIAPAAEKITLAITGGQIIDGTGAPPIPDGVVLIAGKRIAAVGAAGAVQVPDGVKILRAGGMTVMPGLIDMHVHLGMIGSADNGKFVQPRMARQEGEILPAGARQYLMNGVTTVRDVGSPIEIVKVRERIARGEIPGARLFVSGPLLQKRPSDQMTGWGWHISGAEDARLKVRELVAAGVDWIKIHDHQDFSEEEVAAIAEEARRAHKPLAGHGYQDDAEVKRALKYRFNTLEHVGLGRAYEYSGETIRAIIRQDACIVPTLAVRMMFFETEKFPARRNDLIASESLPPDLYTHLNRSLGDYEHLASADVDRRLEKNIRRKLDPLIRGGACVVVGTDSGEPGLIHGSSTWYELKYLMDLGMTSTEAITAATSRPGRLLAPDVGSLRSGFLADIILVKGDVQADIGLLQNVQHVIKDGVQYK
jgi:imidazolonepropionase-like amidohydrolase